MQNINLYHFDIKHEELKFDETYEAHDVREKSVDLKEYFTNYVEAIKEKTENIRNSKKDNN